MAMLRSTDTIFAAASGFGRAAVAIIRISGPATGAILKSLAGGVPDPARRMSLRVLRHPRTGEALDQALVVWMPGPNSFTGEDQAELHIHGGLAVRSAILAALSFVEGCRAAEPGEFTRRAFLNGRLDLSRVEGLADLIDAETEAQRRQALRQLEGSLGGRAEAWREETLQVLALLEASLDFADEGDVPGTLEEEARTRIAGLSQELNETLARPGGERLREGFVVVLTGAPNSGKSTLLNALAQREVAIVSPIAGTTRDIIEVRCDLGGLPVVFVDTAGLRESSDPIEREGVARARARAQLADLVLRLVAPGEHALTDEFGPDLTIGTKVDLGDVPDVDLMVSARTGAGMGELLARIEAEAQLALGGGDAVITRERHRHALTRAAAALARAEVLLREAGPAELAAEEIRLAVRAIGEVTGRVDVEDMLDRLFAAFCIGK